MVDFAQILIKATDLTKGAFDSASRNMRGLQGDANKLNGLLGKIGVGVSVSGLAMYAKATVDFADGLNDMSQRTGVAVKDLASFKLAAEQSGTSLESVGKAIQRLNLSVSQASTNKEMAESLRNLGVTSTDARERLFQLADAYEKSGGKGRDLADIQKVLGKSYGELLPLFSQGSQALRDSAAASATFVEQMAILAPNADKLNDELARLKIGAAGASGAILNEIVPAMADWLGSVNKLIERHGVLTGVLAGLGAAAVPGITAGDLAGDVSLSAFRQQLDEAKAELKTIESATKSGTFGLIQLALYGSEAEMRRKGEYLRSNIKTLEESIAQFEARGKAKPGGALGNNTAQLECIASGGTWDGKTCKRKPTGGGTKSDPLASLLGSTDIGRTQEYNRLLGLLDARFAGGKKNADLYAQAVAKLNEQFGKATLDPLGSGSFKTTDKSVADFISQQQDAINALNSEMAQDGVQAAQEYQSALASLLGDTTRAKTEALQASIDVLNRAFFDGTIGAEQYDEALKNLTEGVPEKINDAGNAFKDFGMIMVSSLEEAIVSGGELGDVLDGLEKDLLRMGTRKMVTDPLSKWVDNFDFGSLSLPGSDQNLLGSFASLFGFADGGIMTSAGPMPLSKYASGGIASTPQLALFGEGSQNEAFVPLPDGKRIPVSMQGGGGGGVTVHMNISTPDVNSFNASRGQITAQYATALQRARRNM